MQYEEFIDYIERYVTAILDVGLKIKCPVWSGNDFVSDFKDFTKRLNARYNRDVFRHDFYTKYINYELFESLFGNNTLVVPDFATIAKRKLNNIFSNIANEDVVFSEDDLNICSKNIAYELNIHWNEMSVIREMCGISIEEPRYIDGIKNNKLELFKKKLDECANINWLNKEKELLNIYSIRSFIEFLIMANRGHVELSRVEDAIHNVYSRINVLNRYLDMLVEHAIGNDKLISNVISYIDRFENSVFNPDMIKERKIYFRFFGNLLKEEKITKKTDSDFTLLLNTYALVAFDFNRHVSNDIMQNAKDFIQMNSCSSSKDFLDFGTFPSESYNIGMQDFELCNFSDSDGKYIIDYTKNRFNNAILVMPLNLTTLNLKPTDIVNFLPEM